MKKIITIILSCCLALFATLSVANLFKNNKAKASELTYVISVTDELSDAAWSNAESYDLVSSDEIVGATGNVKFLVVGNNIYFKLTVADNTRFLNDNPCGSITIGDKTAAFNGKYFGTSIGEKMEWYRVISDDFGDPVSNVVSYENGTYELVIGYALPTNATSGTEVSVTFGHGDATTSDIGWGDGYQTYAHNISFSGTLTIGSVNQQLTYIIPIAQQVNDTAWSQSEEYIMTSSDEIVGATGNVKFLVVGSNLYIKMTVKDTTKNFTDNPCGKFIIGNKTLAFNGKYYDETLGDNGAIGWYNSISADFGQPTSISVTYTLANEYVLNLAYSLTGVTIQGAWVNVDFGHGDATSSEVTWGNGYSSYAHNISFSGTLYIGSKLTKDPNANEESGGDNDPVEDPTPTDGPENVNLNVVIEDLDHVPSEADWTTNTGIDLISLHGNSSGATGKIKIYTAAGNVYFRIVVEDPAFNKGKEGIYIYMGTEEAYYEGRGNVDNWLTPIYADFTTPSLHEEKCSIEDLTGYKPCTVTYSHGFYMPDLAVPGETIRICVKYRDSRSSKEGWVDGDYFHTIYFDQICTFGDKVDTTIRPKTETDGFTAIVEKITYNSVNLKWSEIATADTYKMYVYEVNEVGATEPYTNTSIEGPIYSGDESYDEKIAALSASKSYAIQIIAYDSDEVIVACSNLVKFNTISRADYDKQQEEKDKPSDSGDNKKEETGKETTTKGGCGSVLNSLGLMSMAFCLLFVTKKRK